MSQQPWEAPGTDLDVDPVDRRMTITSVDPISAAKVLGVLYGTMGLIAAAMFALMSVGSVVGGEPGGTFGLLFAVAAPFFYGGMGAVAGLIMALVFNAASWATGGLDLRVR